MLNNQKLCLRVNLRGGTLERDRGALTRAVWRSAVAWVSSPRIRVMGLGRGSTITVDLNGSNPVTLSEIRWREGGRRAVGGGDDFKERVVEVQSNQVWQDGEDVFLQ